MHKNNYYIRGSKDKGKLIIEKLFALGAKDNFYNYNGECENSFYYIDVNGHINATKNDFEKTILTWNSEEYIITEKSNDKKTSSNINVAKFRIGASVTYSNNYIDVHVIDDVRCVDDETYGGIKYEYHFFYEIGWYEEKYIAYAPKFRKGDRVKYLDNDYLYTIIDITKSNNMFLYLLSTDGEYIMESHLTLVNNLKTSNPKFNVGDKVMFASGKGYIFTISKITINDKNDILYMLEGCQGSFKEDVLMKASKFKIGDKVKTYNNEIHTIKRVCQYNNCLNYVLDNDKEYNEHVLRFHKELKEFDPVMVSDNGESWEISLYKYPNNTYTYYVNGEWQQGGEMKYVVPLNDFDFTNIKSNIERNVKPI